MAELFRVWITIRGYELDTQGHLNNAVYHQYGEHARWEYVRAAGISVDTLRAAGIGSVLLESTIRFRRELRDGDKVAVSCLFLWGEGKTFLAAQEFHTEDNDLVAELTSVCGLIDLQSRQLLTAPGQHLRSIATTPQPLGL
jgi:acyl-CoA thioester hydrolase